MPTKVAHSGFHLFVFVHCKDLQSNVFGITPYIGISQNLLKVTKTIKICKTCEFTAIKLFSFKT